MPERRDKRVAERTSPELHWLQRAGTLVWVLCACAALVLWMTNQEALTEWKSQLEPLPYFALLTVAGTVGIPTVPFYLLAVVIFDVQIAIVGAAFTMLGYQTLCYVIARGPLRHWTNPLRQAVERRTPDGWLHSPVARVVLVRMTPGLPTALKNYVAASMGASLPLYLAVSWPIGFLGVSAVILLGDSVVTGRPTEALLALALLLPLIWVGYRYRHLVNAAVPGISKFLPTQGLAPPPALLPHAPRVGTVSADRCKTGGQ